MTPFTPIEPIAGPNVRPIDPQQAQLRAIAELLPADWTTRDQMEGLIREASGTPAWNNAKLGATVLALRNAGLVQARDGERELRRNPSPPEPVSPVDQLQNETARRAAEEHERRESELATAARAQAELRRPFREQEEAHIRAVVKPQLDELTRRLSVSELRVKRLEAQLRALGVAPEGTEEQEQPALAG